MAEISEMEQLLLRESDIVDGIIAEQIELRDAVQNKNWDKLLKTIAKINILTDNFEDAETERLVLEKLQSESSKKACRPLISQLRSKLIKSKTMNKTLGEYISITREFIQGVFDDAMPQGRNTVYSKNGKIVHAQPSSVVVNALT